MPLRVRQEVQALPRPPRHELALTTRRVLLAALLAAVVGVPVVAAEARGAVELHVLSNRADLVSGGDALVEVVLPRADLHRLRVTAAGRDVTSRFALRPNGRVQGLVSGLPVGPERPGRPRRPATGRGCASSTTRSAGRCSRARRRSRGSARTEAAASAAPRRAVRRARRRHRWLYRSTNPRARGFQAYDPAAPPTDVATTTTDEGRSVPFVVRVETGVIDRGIYAIAVLADPNRPWPPWAPAAGLERQGAVAVRRRLQAVAQAGPAGRRARRLRPLDPAAGRSSNVGVDEASAAIFGNGNARGALRARLPGRDQREQQARLAVQHRRLGRVDDDAQGAHRRALRADPLHDRRGRLGRRDAAAPDRLRVPRPARRDPADRRASPTSGSACRRRRTATCSTATSTRSRRTCGPLPPSSDAVHRRPGAAAGCRTQFDGPTTRHARRRQLRGDVARPGQRRRLRPAGRAGLRRAANPRRRALHARRLHGLRLRPARRGRLRQPAVRQRRRAVRPARRCGPGAIAAEQFVDLNEKVGGLDIDWRASGRRAAVADRGGARRRLPRRARHARARARATCRSSTSAGTTTSRSTPTSTRYAMRARLDRDNGHHDNQVVFTGARPLVGDPTSFDARVRPGRRVARAGRGRPQRPGPRAEKVRRNRPADARRRAAGSRAGRITDTATCRACLPVLRRPAHRRRRAAGRRRPEVPRCARCAAPTTRSRSPTRSGSGCRRPSRRASATTPSHPSAWLPSSPGLASRPPYVEALARGRVRPRETRPPASPAVCARTWCSPLRSARPGRP